MKKYAKMIVILGLAGAMLAGCKKQETSAENTPTPTAEPTQEVVREEEAEPETMTAEEPEPTEESIPEGQVVSYLTGEYVPEEIGRRRPVAVMLNNLKPACPQAGIANAGVVYESPVEGGITRLMGIFEDYDNLEKIGSVRSCRDYYIFYAAGFNAIYTHYGQSAYAVPFLNLPEVNNISGLSDVSGYAGESIFYRTTDRKAPHNAYTSFEGIQKGIEKNGYSQEYAKDYQPGYAFCAVDDDIELPGTHEATLIKPGYSINNPWFEYNPEDKLYYRFQYGDKQIDQLTGEQIAYKNIILQYSSWRNYDNHGYLNIDVDEQNVGKYIVNGKAIDITWKKHTPWGATFYYDTNGNQITMDTGKTWVCIILDTYADRVEISGDGQASENTAAQDSEAQAAADAAAAADTEY